jgi:hypothetical protein
VIKATNFGIARSLNWPEREEEVRLDPHITMVQTTLYETQSLYGLKTIRGSITATALVPLSPDCESVCYARGIVTSYDENRLPEYKPF